MNIQIEGIFSVVSTHNWIPPISIPIMDLKSRNRHLKYISVFVNISWFCEIYVLQLLLMNLYKTTQNTRHNQNMLFFTFSVWFSPREKNCNYCAVQKYSSFIIIQIYEYRIVTVFWSFVINMLPVPKKFLYWLGCTTVHLLGFFLSTKNASGMMLCSFLV